MPEPSEIDRPHRSRGDPVRAARLRRGKKIKERAAQRERDNLFSALRGLPETASPACICAPERLGDMLDALLRSMQSPAKSFLQELASQWEHIIGSKENAHACTVGRLNEDGALVIIVPSAVVRSELQFKKADILKRIHALPGGASVRALIMRAG